MYRREAADRERYLRQFYHEGTFSTFSREYFSMLIYKWEAFGGLFVSSSKLNDPSFMICKLLYHHSVL